MGNILNCPCCGAEAVLKETNVCGSNAMRVACPKCHISTSPKFEGARNLFRGEPGKSLTLIEAAQEAIRIWNNRISGGMTA